MPSPFQLPENLYLSNGNNPFGLIAQNTTTTPTTATNPINVPVGQTQQTPTDKKLTDTNAVPMTSQNGPNLNTGITVEITSNAKKETEAQQKQESVKAANKEQTPFVQTGDSFDERLTRYYKEYKNASEERKEELRDKYLTGHFETLKNKSKAEQIKLQMADYKKLLHNTRDGESYRKLAARIHILEKQNQISGAKAATIDQADSELRYQGEIGVASTIHNCDSDNQVELTQMTVSSKNEEAIQEGASHVSKLAEVNETEAVKIYQTAEIRDEAKKLVDRTIIDQYKDFAIANQVDIHQVMSASKFSETVEYAASNIYNFDKTNQAAAVKVTMNTGNEKAINAAASQYANYDKSAQAAVKEVLSTSRYESTKTALAAAETSAKIVVGDKKAVSTESSQSSKSTQTASEVRVAAVKQIIEANQPNVAVLKDAVKNLSDIEKIALLRQYPNNGDLVHTILTSNPSLDVLAELSKLLKDEQSIKKVNNDKLLIANIGFLSASAQSTIIRKASTLDYIQRTLLNGQAKATYDERLNEINGKNGVNENVVTA